MRGGLMRLIAIYFGGDFNDFYRFVDSGLFFNARRYSYAKKGGINNPHPISAQKNIPYHLKIRSDKIGCKNYHKMRNN